ncbi:MAG: hypothetical protein WCL02_03825 [bacterium]
MSFSTSITTLLFLYHFSPIYVVTSLDNVVLSKIPATLIFTHPVNSSEYLALPKNKNIATISARVQKPTHTYACFIIENGAFIIKSIIV